MGTSAAEAASIIPFPREVEQGYYCGASEGTPSEPTTINSDISDDTYSHEPQVEPPRASAGRAERARHGHATQLSRQRADGANPSKPRRRTPENACPAAEPRPVTKPIRRSVANDVLSSKVPRPPRLRKWLSGGVKGERGSTQEGPGCEPYAIPA
ncbi:hypothetical protein BDV93DRAFT_565577 [Ceratobasidium sp. AG-I]|nr:hypothetical protein BDV93DRAFT_565577 [Ceratobasidium sp. AG-I]